MIQICLNCSKYCKCKKSSKDNPDFSIGFPYGCKPNKCLDFTPDETLKRISDYLKPIEERLIKKGIIEPKIELSDVEP